MQPGGHGVVVMIGIDIALKTLKAVRQTPARRPFLNVASFSGLILAYPARSPQQRSSSSWPPAASAHRNLPLLLGKVRSASTRLWKNPRWADICHSARLMTNGMISPSFLVAHDAPCGRCQREAKGAKSCV